MHRTTRRPLSRPEAMTLAQGLGLFSLALGAAEIVAPRRVAAALGMKGQEDTIALHGLREIVSGVGILASRDPTPWLCARVAGDAVDAATLAPALARDNPQRANAGIAMLAVAGAAILDVVAAQSLWASRHQEAQRRRRLRHRMHDYASRSGLPRSPEAMRGAAANFEVPADMRVPEALRPWTEGRRDAVAH